jgi:hypothetical protein
MKQTFTLLAAISLLLFATFTFLWLRTSCKIDLVQSERFGQPWSIGSTSGSIELSLMSPTWLQTNPGRPPAGLNWSTITADRFHSPWPLYPLPGIRRVGVGRTATAPNCTVVSLGQTTYHVPYWIPTIAFGLLPAAWLWRYWRARRRNRGKGFEVSGPQLPATA